MTSPQIREELKASNVFQHEVCNALGISESTFIRWLRKPLDDKKRKHIMEAIEVAKNLKEEQES